MGELAEVLSSPIVVIGRGLVSVLESGVVSFLFDVMGGAMVSLM